MVDQAENYLNSLQHPPTPSRPTEIEVLNPITGAIIGRVPNATAEQVRVAAERARVAQKVWAAMPVKKRAKIIKRFCSLLLKNQKKLIASIRAENGKAHGSAYAEIAVATMIGQYYARNARKWLKPEKRKPILRGFYTARVYHQPLGVVGNISPWNYPLVLNLLDMLPALIAGNSVITKPSEITPLTALELVKLFEKAGLPKDTYQVITGYGDVGAELVNHVDFIMFTGSTATGRRVAVRAAERLIPCSLELGGNDPMIVLKDANIDLAAANAVSAGFENTGQLCMGIERVIVEAPIYEPFLEAAQKWQAKLVIGKADGFKVHAGSLTNQRELERSQEHIQDALDKGARLIAGGKPLPELGPLFFEATILADVTPEMRVAQEETFGPILAIMKAADTAEALRLANADQYGLSGSVWGGNKKRAEEIALKIETGSVNINCSLISFGTADVEFGGVRDSGLGQRNGKQGLLKYTHPKSIVIDNRPQDPGQPTIYSPRVIFLANWVYRFKKVFPFIGS